MRQMMLVLAMLVFCLGVLAQDDEFGLDPSDFQKKPGAVQKKKPPQDDEFGLAPSDFGQKNGEKPAPDTPQVDDNDNDSGDDEAEVPDGPMTQGAGDGERGTAPVRLSEDTSTRYITISGALALYFVFRDDLFDNAVNGGANRDDFDEDFFDPRLSLQIDAQLERNVHAVVELQNEARDDQFHQTSLGLMHVTSRSAQNTFRFEFEKAYLEFSEFLFDGFMLQAGIIPQRYSLRADGQAFFMDLKEAESPFSSRADTHAIGVFASYKPINVLDLYFDAFYLITSESGFNRRDETVSGLNIDFDFSKDVIRESDDMEMTLVRLFNLYIAAIQGDNNSPIWTLGFGYSYFMCNAELTYTVELYGEILFQFGDGYQLTRPATPIREQNHLALATYAGFQWKSREGWQPFIDVSYWYLSGDDGDPNSDLNRDPVTYEDVDSTLIIEDNDYGLDIDSNYWAVKCQAGFNIPVANEEMRMSMIYAHFEINDSPGGRTHKLGEEIDVRFTWEYTTDVVFSLAAGVLWDSQYLEEFYAEVGGNQDEHAFLFRAETSLVF